MSIDAIKISALSQAPDPLSGNEELPGNQASTTYKILARKFVLPSDPLLTTVDFRGYVPGSRPMVAGPGITLLLTADAFTISAVAANLILNQVVIAALSSSQEDWNPTGWDGGNQKNRFQVTPAAAVTLGGLDSSNTTDGQVVGFLNDSAVQLWRFLHNSSFSNPANRFLCPGGATYSLAPYQGALAMATASGWRFL